MLEKQTACGTGCDQCSVVDAACVFRNGGRAVACAINIAPRAVELCARAA